MTKQEHKIYDALLKAAVALKEHVEATQDADNALRALSVGIMHTSLKTPIMMAIQVKNAAEITKIKEND